MKNETTGLQDQTIKGSKLFSLGQVVITTTASDQLPPEDIDTALRRHQAGDWGVVVDEDCKANDDALNHNDRILSSYLSTGGVKFWIITEWDRSVTTVLLPEEY